MRTVQGPVLPTDRPGPGGLIVVTVNRYRSTARRRAVDTEMTYSSQYQSSSEHYPRYPARTFVEKTRRPSLRSGLGPVRGGSAVARKTPAASFGIAGNQRFPACGQNAPRSDDIAGRRPASGQNPQDSGNITKGASRLSNDHDHSVAGGARDPRSLRSRGEPLAHSVRSRMPVFSDRVGYSTRSERCSIRASVSSTSSSSTAAAGPRR